MLTPQRNWCISLQVSTGHIPLLIVSDGQCKIAAAQTLHTASPCVSPILFWVGDDPAVYQLKKSVSYTCLFRLTRLSRV